MKIYFIFIYFFFVGSFFLLKKFACHRHISILARAADCSRSHLVCINRYLGCLKLFLLSICDEALDETWAENTKSEYCRTGKEGKQTNYTQLVSEYLNLSSLGIRKRVYLWSTSSACRLLQPSNFNWHGTAFPSWLCSQEFLIRSFPSAISGNSVLLCIPFPPSLFILLIFLEKTH